jgi:type I restriction enzyme S subunit
LGNDGWTVSTFARLIEAGILEIGDGYQAQNAELGGDGPIFLRAGHVADTHIDFTGVERFRSDLADRVRPKMSRPGDVIITTKGNSTGRVSHVTPTMPPFVYSPHLSFWRTRDPRKLDPGFLRYWSRSQEFRSQLLGLKGSTDMAPYLSLADQKRLRITMPPRGQQQSIGESLGALDKKIDLNRRMNETLEAIARALFRSWFVDFDPVRAKQEGRQPAGMDAETAALFPDSFEDSPLGKIPRGWRVRPMEEQVEAVKGLSYKGSGLSKEGLPLHNLNSVHEGGGYKYEGIKFYTGEYKERHVIRPGDVIVANTEQGHKYLLIGYPAIVPRRFGDFGLFSHHTFRVRPLKGSPLTPGFIYLALLDARLHDEIVGHTNGTTVNMLTVDGLQRPLMIAPTEQVVQAFDRVVGPILGKREASHEESLALAALRDALLPKLLSGEIRVKPTGSLTEPIV